MTKQKEYKNADIVNIIRHRIIFNEYSPGQLLNDASLMKEFGVSRTPVREALIRLAVEGFVRTVPHRGTYVTELTLSDLRDVFEVRLPLLKLVGRLAAVRVTDQEIKALRLLQERAKNPRMLEELLEVDIEFHEIVRIAAKNEVLARTLRLLQQRASRAWNLVDDKEMGLHNLADEIGELLEGLKAKDADRCEEALSKHYIGFVAQIQGVLGDNLTQMKAQGGAKL